MLKPNESYELSNADLRIETLIETAQTALQILEVEYRENPNDDDLENDQWYLEELYALIDDNCPDTHYYGSHVGDGACIGFWSIIEYEDYL